MINILYVPLDERDCNYRYPSWLAGMAEGIRLIVPPASRMGKYKEPADADALWQWLFDHAERCDYAILSVDTLIYGNIINSRIHRKSHETCAALLDRFRRLKCLNPGLKIHAFSLVARVAAYNSSMEDPDYWEKYGHAIWRATYLADKLARGRGSDAETQELEKLRGSVPPAVRRDFLHRREIDRFVNLSCVDLVAEGVFDRLNIPKDDTAEYGYAAMDQQAVSRRVREKRVMDRVLVYPGADEAGCTLLARVCCLTRHYTPRIYVRYSSVLGPQIVPKYEDRPLHESVKSQITSIGGILVETEEQADCLLAIHAPGKQTVEAHDQKHKDPSHSSFSNGLELLRYAQYFTSRLHKPAGIAEVAVCNGCDNDFMELMRTLRIDETAASIGGWNTAQNTIGTVLAQTVITAGRAAPGDSRQAAEASCRFRLYSLVHDWFFQSNVLPRFLHAHPEIDPFAIAPHYEEVCRYFQNELTEMLNQKFPDGYGGRPVIRNLGFQWNSAYFITFDIGLEHADMPGRGKERDCLGKTV